MLPQTDKTDTHTKVTAEDVCGDRYQCVCRVLVTPFLSSAPSCHSPFCCKAVLILPCTRLGHRTACNQYTRIQTQMNTL